MKQTEIKPNYIYEIEAMWLDAEEERVKKYQSMMKFSSMYYWTCKRISMINIDQEDLMNFLMDYIKILIETNNVDNFELRVSKFLETLSYEEIVDKELSKTLRVFFEEFSLLNQNSFDIMLSGIENYG